MYKLCGHKTTIRRYLLHVALHCSEESRQCNAMPSWYIRLDTPSTTHTPQYPRYIGSAWCCLLQSSSSTWSLVGMESGVLVWPCGRLINYRPVTMVSVEDSRPGRIRPGWDEAPKPEQGASQVCCRPVLTNEASRNNWSMFDDLMGSVEYCK